MDPTQSNDALNVVSPDASSEASIHASPAVDVAPNVAASPPSRGRFLRAFVRLLSWRTALPDDVAAPTKLSWLLPLFGIAVWLGLDRWWAGSEPLFFPQAIYVWSWYVVVVLGLSLIASRLARPAVPLPRVLVLAAAFVPVFVALQLAQEEWVGYDWWSVALLAIAVYAAGYLARGVQSLTSRRQPLVMVVVALLFSAAMWATQRLSFSSQFWYPSEYAAENESASDYLEQMRQSEALLFSQAQRIDALVERVQRPASATPAAFFVGFAGMGEQRVFAGEIAMAETVIADKFGSAQRSVRLVNDRRDLETYPLASGTALRHALKRLATRMNLETDVLFLSLSSHGSKDGELSVSNGMLSLNALSADEVADALRDSGIRWRVVIVSACYAGKFIAPLQDENTIVIAAAAADRNSFGCADDRDLTYFGEAFYRDALPSSSDLRAAFQRAVVAIDAREKAENKRASLPQAHFGERLEVHLREAFGSR